MCMQVGRRSLIVPVLASVRGKQYLIEKDLRGDLLKLVQRINDAAARNTPSDFSSHYSAAHWEFEAAT